MKALAFGEHGGLDRLRYQDVADPKIGPRDVLVRVRAAALNHLDLFVREGLPGLTLPMPFWTGCDIAGDVAAIGAEVRDVAVGDRVAVNPNLYDGTCEFCLRGEHSLCVRYGILGEHTHGGLAEYVAVEGRHVVTLPAAVAYEDAAAFVLVNMTALNSASLDIVEPMIEICFQNTSRMSVSAIGPEVAPQVTMRPPLATVRIAPFQVAAPTFSSTTSTPRRPVFWPTTLTQSSFA